MRNIAKHTSIALAMALVAATSAGAQGAGPKWQAWVGCWTSAGVGESYGSSQFAAPIVCVVPTANTDVVEIATIADGKVAKRDTIDASGVAKAIQSKDCQGSQVAHWSADERRVYLSSSATCFGTKSNVSSILAMSDKGEWLDIRGVKTGEGENVRVARYRDIGLPSSVPAEITDALRGRNGAQSGARVAAGANIGTTAVAEATKAVDASVVEAWLLERGQRFALNANTLVALADAGIPSSVTDAMVAVSNPGAFQLARAESGSRDGTYDESENRYGRRIPVYLDPYDPWGYGYSRYGYSRYGYGYGYGLPYGYGGYGYGLGYGGYGGPIIIVTNSTPGGVATLGNPQVVKGRGYTQNNPSASNGRSASPSTQSSPSGSSSSTSSSTSQPAPQPQPSEQRTAKPRP